MSYHHNNKIVIFIALMACSLCYAGSTTLDFQANSTMNDMDAQTSSSDPTKSSIAEKLQQVSVTIQTESGEGSGVIVKRGEHNYVLTAGHVIDSLKQTITVVDSSSGIDRKIVDFQEAHVVQTIYEHGRKVGKLDMSAEVVCYSNAEHGEDLAVLRILKRGFIDQSAWFYLDGDIPPAGTELYHVGSLKGEFGSNSVTTGIISQVGRLYNKKLYDQTNCTAFPGSSGGGIFEKANGQYIGMLTRGSGETFNLIVPIRRIRIWTDKMHLSFILDPTLPVPTEEELIKIPIEDTGKTWQQKEAPVTTWPSIDYTPAVKYVPSTENMPNLLKK